MGVTDHRPANNKQRVTIVTVDPTQRRVQGALKDGGPIEIAVWEVDSFFVWPQQGETWTVNYQNGYWMLGSRILELDSNTQVEALSPGQARIGADTILTPSGNSVVTTNAPTANRPLVWTGTGWSTLQLTTAGLADGAVTTPKLADTAVTTAKVTDGAVTPVKRSGGFKTGNFTSHATTGNKAITGVGFQPKFVKFYTTRETTGAGGVNEIRQGSGRMDGTSQSSMYFAQNDADLGNSAQSFAIGSAIFQADRAGTAVYEARYVSFDSDGFTINVITAINIYRVLWEAYG